MNAFKFPGITFFEYDGYCDMFGHGEQYKVIEWKTQNTQQYDGMYAVVSTAGKSQILTEAVECA